MLSASFHGIGDIRVEEVPKPQCGPGEALIKIAYAGICGSDLHIVRKGMFVTNVPEIMGHEFAGVIEEIGPGVTTVTPGDHVVGDPRVSCGSCSWCLEGRYNLCPELGFIGEVAPGCFAQYIVMKEDRLFKIPKNIDLKTAALVEPLAVAMHIATTGSFSPNDRVGIIGAGPIGIMSLLVAKAMKVKHVTVVDISETRLDIAKRLGADWAVKSIPADPQDAVDVAVEAAGLEVTLQGSLDWLKPGGRLVMAGIYEQKVLLDPNPIIGKEIKAAGIHAYGTKNLVQAVNMLSEGKLANIDTVISHVLPLKDTPAAFDKLMSKDQTASKILLNPWA